MKAIRKASDIPSVTLDHCHDGDGALDCFSLLDGLGSQKFPYIHRDFMVAGTSIGDHPHTTNEEIYYLLCGRGILTFDGEAYAMEAGDISLCPPGHTHGYAAEEDSILLVISSTFDA